MKLRYLLLIIFSLVSAVPLAIYWALPNPQPMTEEMEDARERHLLLAETLAIALEGYQREVSATFRLVHANLVRHGRVEGADELLQELHFRNICVFEAATGQLLLRFDSFDNRCPESLDPDEPTRLGELAMPDRVVFSPVLAGTGDEPTLYVVEARDGLLAVGSLYPDFFARLGGSIDFGRSGYAVIIDQTGQVLWHPDETWRRQRYSFADVAPAPEIREGRSGVAVYRSPLLQKEVVAGYAPVGGIGWGVLVVQPVEELEERAARASYAALVVVAFGMLAALLIGYLVAFYMTRPLRAVSLAVRRMAAGNTEARTDVSSGVLVPAEVRELQTAFNAMAEAMERSKRDEQEARLRAEEANRSKSAFLANMSHELRTPLNAVLGFSEVILAETFGKIGSARYTEYLGDIRTSARHLLALINDLLDLSRIEAGAMKLDDNWISLGDVLDESSAMFRENCARKGVTLRLEAPGDEIAILADERALRQILINLLSNAVRHTPAGGEVVLGARPASEGRLEIFVADTGVGIPAADIERVLQPFEQVTRDQGRPQEGTGLGLSIVKQLIDLHGGELTLESEVGKGTRVTFTLPADRVNAAGGAGRAKAAP
ncbi:MAG: sensor histidine kinase [Kiloniellaceae bacterium]